MYNNGSSEVAFFKVDGITGDINPNDVGSVAIISIPSGGVCNYTITYTSPTNPPAPLPAQAYVTVYGISDGFTISCPQNLPFTITNSAPILSLALTQVCLNGAIGSGCSSAGSPPITLVAGGNAWLKEQYSVINPTPGPTPTSLMTQCTISSITDSTGALISPADRAAVMSETIVSSPASPHGVGTITGASFTPPTHASTLPLTFALDCQTTDGYGVASNIIETDIIVTNTPPVLTQTGLVNTTLVLGVGIASFNLTTTDINPGIEDSDLSTTCNLTMVSGNGALLGTFSRFDIPSNSLQSMADGAPITVNGYLNAEIGNTITCTPPCDSTGTYMITCQSTDGYGATSATYNASIATRNVAGTITNPVIPTQWTISSPVDFSFYVENLNTCTASKMTTTCQVACNSRAVYNLNATLGVGQKDLTFVPPAIATIPGAVAGTTTPVACAVTCGTTDI